MSETAGPPLTRRTVAKGAAWTAPVVLGGVAAPAYAASGPKPTVTAGPACKLPGNSCNPAIKGYVFVFSIQNTGAETIYIYSDPAGTSPLELGPIITTVPVDNKGPLPLSYAGGYVGSEFYDPGDSIEVPAGGVVNFQLYAEAGNSANRVFGYSVSFQWGHTSDPADDLEHRDNPAVASVSVAGTPPCDNCQPPPPGSTATSTVDSSAKDAARSVQGPTSETSPAATGSEPTPTTTSAPPTTQSVASEPAPTSTETTP